MSNTTSSSIKRFILIEGVLFLTIIVLADLLKTPVMFVLLGVGLLLVTLPYLEGNIRVPPSDIYSVYNEFAQVEINDYKNQSKQRNMIPLFPYLTQLGLPLVVMALAMIIMAV